MHNGDDTHYYLSKANKVVAIEANPDLCKTCTTRFYKEIKEGRLIILNIMISDRSGISHFFLNNDDIKFSSSILSWADKGKSNLTQIDVQEDSILKLFEEYGVPNYLKIDVEGVDLLILRNLLSANLSPTSLPKFISVEDCRFGFEYVDLLNKMGYKKFKILDQSTIPNYINPYSGKNFPLGSSGPFGDDIPGEWLDKVNFELLYETTVRTRQGIRLKDHNHWLDIHASI